nr:MAG TPA: hypothetical protein [Caudoviricetes sp.]
MEQTFYTCICIFQIGVLGAIHIRPNLPNPPIFILYIDLLFRLFHC